MLRRGGVSQNQETNNFLHIVHENLLNVSIKSCYKTNVPNSM